MSSLPLEQHLSILESIGYYTSAVVLPPRVKGAVFAFCGAISYFTQWAHIQLDFVAPMAILCLTDLVTGIIKGCMLKQFSSGHLYRFVPKWISYVALILGVSAITKYHPALESLPNMVIGMIAFNEFVSTIENIRCAGIIKSNLLDKVLRTVKAVIDKDSSDEAQEAQEATSYDGEPTD